MGSVRSSGFLGTALCDKRAFLDASVGGNELWNNVSLLKSTIASGMP